MKDDMRRIILLSMRPNVDSTAFDVCVAINPTYSVSVVLCLWGSSLATRNQMQEIFLSVELRGVDERGGVELTRRKMLCLSARLAATYTTTHAREYGFRRFAEPRFLAILSSTAVKDPSIGLTGWTSGALGRSSAVVF